MPKVSIVVPVYKVEQQLERCIISLINQTLYDIEIILINDGSPDKSPEICDSFAKKDSRIKVIHKQNGGQSSARNAGIRAACGEYLGFIDSDDYAEPNMFEKLYNCANKHKVDFVMADYWRVSETTRDKKTLDIREGLYTKNDIIKEIFPVLIMRENVDFGPLLSLWNCLYKTDFIKSNNLYLDEEIRWAEDSYFSSTIGYKANSFYYLKNEYVYNYIQNVNSVSTSYSPKLWKYACLMNKKIRTYFSDTTDFNFSRQLDLHLLYFASCVFSRLKYTNYKFREKHKIRKKILSDKQYIDCVKKLKMPKGSIKENIYWFLMKHRCAFLLSLI